MKLDSFSIYLLAFCMGIDDSVEDIRVWSQVCIMGRIHLIQANHVGKKSIRFSSRSFLSAFGVGIDHGTVCNNVWTNVWIAIGAELVHLRE